MSGDDGYEEPQTLKCSFCGKAQNEVKKLISGPDNVTICDECVELCAGLVYDEAEEASPLESENTYIPTPKQICAILDDYVIGQEQAKRVLSVAVYNHYKRLAHFDVAQEDNEGDIDLFNDSDKSKSSKRHPFAAEAVEISKSNVLLVGPTGCGKTLLAQTLARILNVPFAVADATSLTEAGYVGEDVENVLYKLVQAANGDKALAERGIIYIDEVDKITRKSENPSITRDVSGEGVQQALLKIMEGTMAMVPPQGGRKHPQQDFTQIDTTNILFICGGAFVGIEKIIEQHAIKGQRIGFGADVPEPNARPTGELLQELTAEDLHKYGLIPEFIGRLPVIATLTDLDAKSLVRILTEPKNALVKQYRRLFDMERVDLHFTPDALTEIALKAINLRSGARSLRALLEKILLEAMYEVPDSPNVSRVVVNKEVVVKGGRPLYLYDETNQKSA